MITYLLNLKRRPDRLRAALAECEKAGVRPTVFEAVDGTTLSLPDGWKQFPPGALGCNLSHVKILEDAISKGHDTITVFEDDVVFAHDFQLKLNRFMEIVPQDWDAIFLGGQVVGHVEPVVPGVVRAAGEKGIHRTHAYMLRGKYLHFMLNEWKTKVGHVDWVWGESQKDWKVYAPDRWLCAQSGSPSDISGRKFTSPKWWEIQQHHMKPKPKAGCNSCGKKLTPEQLEQRQKRMAKSQENYEKFMRLRRERLERQQRSKEQKEKGESQS